MKKIFTLLAVLFVTLNAAAVPAKPIKRTITLADGSTVTATLRGDENFHFYVTDDGRALTVRPDGLYQFTDEQTITHNWQKRTHLRNLHRLIPNQKLRTSSGPHREFGVPGKIVGQKKGIVILVNFNESGKTMKHTQSEFNNQFNQVGYSKNSHIGSVRDYFLKQSYEQLTIDFDVVGPYKLAHNMSYYGRNASFVENTETGMIEFDDWNNNGDDINAFEMIYEACKAADKDVNFKDYDWDGDGEVEQVYVIYAGYGEAQGAPSNTIWPHEYELDQALYYTGLPDTYPDLSTFANLHLDGVKINTYACSNELNGTSGSVMDGIGTACHEFTHCLGIPDFYDIAYRNFGMGGWDLMDSGSYNCDGNVPAAYTAYERWFSGWLEPVELDGPATITNMPAITDEPVCYVMYNAANRNEYYLLQNIQQTSWNKYAEGHGMLVQHIFYDKAIWQANEPNCTSGTSGNKYQRCTIIPADNKLSSNNLSGDPFPNGTKNELTDSSTPKASLYVNNSNGQKLMHHPITEIAETKGLISFLVDGGLKIETPEAYEVEPEDISEGAFVAMWSKCDHADSYTIELSQIVQPDQPDESPLILYENFSGVKSVTSGNTDISGDLDKYLNLPGWTGSKLFSGALTGGSSGLKFASSSAAGTLQSPQFDAPSSGMVTVYAEGKPYGSDAMNFTITILTSDGTSVSQTFTSSPMCLTASVEGPYSILFETPKGNRYYHYTIKTANGRYTENDMATMTADASTLGPIATVIRTVTDVKETFYYFDDLDMGTYSFRVKAIDAEGNESEWSNTIEVEISTATGISSMNNEQLRIHNDEVYDLTGRKLSTLNSQHSTLPKGIYLVNGKKVLVK